MATIDKLLMDLAGLTAQDVQTAKQASIKNRTSLMRAVEELPSIDHVKVLAAFAQFYGVQACSMDEVTVAPGILELLDAKTARELRVVPIDKAGNNLIVATADPKNLTAINRIRQKTGFLVRPVLASDAQITGALSRYYGENFGLDQLADAAIDFGNSGSGLGEGRQQIGESGSSDGPIIGLVNKLLSLCIEKGASDIHIEPYEKEMRVRLRVDGTLIVIARPPLEIRDALLSRVKIMAGINIAEKRLPQDGGIRVQFGEKPIDFRVNTLPTVYGEKIVLRILDKSNLQVDMTALGFESDDLDKLKEAIHRPYGMVLVTGPTGSGKTTTLYSALAELNKTTENIITAEDPVEYNLDGINQVQMKSEIGLNFAAALRAFLRQDPDVIMVGEIRDLETAEIGIKAALTGHMMLSTLHTNSAADTVSRLLNMGVEGFNLVSALNCIVAQRLARRICTKCRIVDESVTPEQLEQLGIHPAYTTKVKAYRGRGCSHCNGQGNKGRVAIHEVMLLNDEIRDAILKNRPAMDIKRIAMATGMRSLRQAALNKMVQGVISAQEVIRNTNSDTDSHNKQVSAA